MLTNTRIPCSAGPRYEQRGWVTGHGQKWKQNLAYRHKHECITVMQSSGRGGNSRHGRAPSEALWKTPSRFPSCKPSPHRPQDCIRKIFRELSYKIVSHGSLPLRLLYLLYLLPASLLIPDFWKCWLLLLLISVKIKLKISSSAKIWLLQTLNQRYTKTYIYC